MHKDGTRALSLLEYHNAVIIAPAFIRITFPEVDLAVTTPCKIRIPKCIQSIKLQISQSQSSNISGVMSTIFFSPF